MAKYFPDGKGSNLVNTESNDEHFEKTDYLHTIVFIILITIK